LEIPDNSMLMLPDLSRLALEIGISYCSLTKSNAENECEF